MKKLIFNFLREWFDPAWERTPYNRAMEQQKNLEPTVIARWSPRRRFSLK